MGEWTRLLRNPAVVALSLLYIILLAAAARIQHGELQQHRAGERAMQDAADAAVARARSRTAQADYRYRQGMRGAAVGEARWMRMPSYVASNLEPFAILPRSRWSALSVGEQPSQIEGMAVKSGRGIEAPGTPLRFLQGSFDSQRLSTLLIPLLAVVVAAFWLAEERESGRLPLLMLFGGFVPVVWRKVTARIAWTVLVGELGCAAAGVAAIGKGYDDATLLRLGLWMAATALYAATCTCAVLAATWTATTSFSALSRAVMAVLIVAVVIPEAGRSAARLARPVRSRALEEAAIRNARADAVEAYVDSERRTALFATLERKLLDDFPELANERGEPKHRIRGAAWRFHWERILDEGLNRIEDDVFRQRQLQDRLSVLSPTASFESFGMAVFSSGWVRQHRFMRQVSRDRRSFAAAFWPKEFLQKGDPGDYTPETGFTPDDYDQHPTFRFEEPSLREDLSAAVPALAGLISWAILCALLLVALSRRDVRARFDRTAIQQNGREG